METFTHAEDRERFGVDSKPSRTQKEGSGSETDVDVDLEGAKSRAL
jgi:hypothetical protein